MVTAILHGKVISINVQKMYIANYFLPLFYLLHVRNNACSNVFVVVLSFLAFFFYLKATTSF